MASMLDEAGLGPAHGAGSGVAVVEPSAPLPKQVAGSQTLDRGLRVLEVLAEAEAPLMIAEVCERVGLHRSIVYRMVRTLEEHSLVVRDAAGALRLGAGLAVLARAVERDLQSAVLPELTTLSNELGTTAFLVVLDESSATTLVSVEPRHSHATVAQRPGTRHGLDVGAPGSVLRAQLSGVELAQRGLGVPELSVLDARGGSQPGAGSAVAADAPRVYAVSRDQVIPGLSSVAVPLSLPDQAPAALAVVYVSHDLDPARLAARLWEAAEAVATDLA